MYRTVHKCCHTVREGCKNKRYKKWSYPSSPISFFIMIIEVKKLSKYFIYSFFVTISSGYFLTKCEFSPKGPYITPTTCGPHVLKILFLHSSHIRKRVIVVIWDVVSAKLTYFAILYFLVFWKKLVFFFYIIYTICLLFILLNITVNFIKIMLHLSRLCMIRKVITLFGLS